MGLCRLFGVYGQDDYDWLVAMVTTIMESMSGGQQATGDWRAAGPGQDN